MRAWIFRAKNVCSSVPFPSGNVSVGLADWLLAAARGTPSTAPPAQDGSISGLETETGPSSSAAEPQDAPQLENLPMKREKKVGVAVVLSPLDGRVAWVVLGDKGVWRL